MCVVKIGDKQTEFFPQRRGVHQGCNLSVTLTCCWVGSVCYWWPFPPRQRGEVSVFSDYLVLLSPTEQGLQQQLDILEKYCQNWALAVNMKKTNVIIFQKCPRCQENKHQFTINSHITEHRMSYPYLGITTTASGSFNMAVNALKEKAQRAFHAIKSQLYNFQFSVKICLKFLIVSSSPLRSTVVKCEVHSILSTLPAGINIQQNLYM